MILVTGGTGLVGSHLLLDLVRTGKTVRAIHRKSSDLQAVKNVFSYTLDAKEAEALFMEIEWQEADITDIPSLERAFEGITHVYHCAATVTFDPGAYQKLRKSNIEGTANIVNFCIAKAVKKLCYVSSIATFDKSPGSKVITESSSWNKEQDHSAYGITKYGAEMEVWRGTQEGVPAVIVNPGVIIGPGFWNSGSGEIFRRINNGLKFHFPKVTGFVGVWDVARAMQQLMDAPVQNQQYILVADNLPFNEILKTTAENLSKPAPKIQLKPWMVFLGWISQKTYSFFSRGKQQLTRSDVKALFEETFYRSEKIKAELDFEFEQLDTVISKTATNFKKDIRE